LAYSLPRVEFLNVRGRMSGTSLQNLAFILLLALVLYVATLGGA
jgi:hypothetical protein